MAYSFIQAASGHSGGYNTSIAKAFASNVTAGSKLVAFISVGTDAGSTVASVTDSLGNTWTKIDDGAAEFQRGEAWETIAGSSGACTVTATYTSGYHDGQIIISEHGGLANEAYDQKSEVVESSYLNSHPVSATPTLSQADELALFFYAGDSNSTYSLGSGWTGLVNQNASDLYGSAAMQRKTVSSTSGVSGSIDSGTYMKGYGIIVTFKIATASATLEQEGFAFGDDDGSQSAHTLDTQDTNVTEPLGTKTLRMLINATNDPSSNAYKLKYQKNGTGGYSDVPIVSGSAGATGAIESADITESGNNTASSSWSISHPAASTGDLLIFNIAWDDSTNVTGLTAPSGPNGETAVVIEDIVASAGTSVRGKVVYYIATGAWSAGSLTFTPSASEQWTAAVIKVPAGEFDATTPIGAHNNEPSVATSAIHPVSTSDITAGSTDGDGRLVSFIVVDTYALTGSMTGWTQILNRDRGAVAIGVYTRDSLVTDSESITGTTGLSPTSAASWVSFGYIVRPPITTNEIYISPSSNVAAGGEATTARLTAPSGKTTSDFDTGRRWDDENGSDSIDITDDDYTELEWVLTTQSPAATDDYYDFRVYDGDTALDTYTVTPRWTIGAGDTISEAGKVSWANISQAGTVTKANIAAIGGVTT